MIQLRHYSEKVGHTYTSQKKKIVIDTEAPIIEAMKADGWVDGSYSLTIPVTDKVSFNGRSDGSVGIFL